MFAYPPQFPDATVETYKSIDDIQLKIWRFEPADHPSTDNRPAVLFFFGGGFRMGSPAQFAPQARYLATRGVVALTADYRVSERHQTKIVQCVEDAKTAMRWTRDNAAQLGIDPERIAAAGGSAGGMLAAATGILPGYDEQVTEVCSGTKPNAMILFNPALILAPVEGREMEDDVLESLIERVGAPAESLSPIHHLRSGLPPTIIFHGEADTTIPYDTVELFAQRTRTLGNQCELVGYPGETHGFFNFGRGDGSAYSDTLRRTDAFLVSLGWLQPVSDSSTGSAETASTSVAGTA